MSLPTPYYDRDGITIYCGDCREILPRIEKSSVDLLLTDPPYEIVATGGGIVKDREYLAQIDGFTDGGFDESILYQFHSWVCFCAKSQLAKLIAVCGGRRWMLVTWNKPNPTPLVSANYLPDTEYIVHAWSPGRLFGDYRDRSRFILHAGDRNGIHPNVKPIGVVSKMIRLGTKPSELILDPFMGSGTTLVAAKLEGRKAIGIEIEEKYCEIAVKRLAQGVLAFP